MYEINYSRETGSRVYLIIANDNDYLPGKISITSVQNFVEKRIGSERERVFLLFPLASLDCFGVNLFCGSFAVRSLLTFAFFAELQ